MPGLLESNGAQSTKPQPWAPVFLETLWPGIATNRAALHPYGTVPEQVYYKGRPGVLISGSNTEISVRNTLIRRYGTTPFSTATYPTPPARAFDFQLTNGTIQVIIDSASTGNLAVSAVAASTGTTPNLSAAFTGVFPGGASNAYVGLTFTITGFTNVNNNGSWVCTASTTTTITLTGIVSATTAETHAATAVSAGGVWYDQQNGSKTLLFSKKAGAGQTAFSGEAGILYAGDGVDVWKYTPGNTNGTVWNWGIVAPANQPTVTIVPAATAAVPWQANTIFSTMGLVLDTANSIVYQLQNINNSATNTTRFATTGTGQPVWNQTPGMTTPDNGGTWTNFGPVVLWTANTEYDPATPTGGTTANPCAIYDPVTKAMYLNGNQSGPGRSGVNKPNFKAAVGQGTKDGSITWFYIGPTAFPLTWVAGHVYPALSGATDSIASVVEPNSLANGLVSSTPTYWQVALGGLTSASSAVSPFTTSTMPLGFPATDGINITWLSLGSYVRVNGQTMTAWTVNGATFSVIVDTVTNNFFVCTTSGVAGNSTPTFNTGYGAVTPDGTGAWTCVGTSLGMAWTANTTWYLPVGGFAPPSSSQPEGGAAIKDNQSTPAVEFTVNSGLSGASQPTWNPLGATTSTGDTLSGSQHAITSVAVAVGVSTYTGTFGTSGALVGQTIVIAGFANAANNGRFQIITQNTTTITVTASSLATSQSASATGIIGLIWLDVAPFTQVALVTATGRSYAYSYKARALDDFYSTQQITIDPVTGVSSSALPTPPGANPSQPLPFPPTGSQTGAVSSASPATSIGPDTGAVNTITGFYSNDPQVDTIIIWRSGDEADGSDNMFELTEIPNIPQANGLNKMWSFQDFLPDVPTTESNGIIYPGLNNLIPAPIDGVNNPPPSNFLPMAYNYQRIWGSVGQAIDFSGGPDTLVGNPNEAFNASNEFPFLSNVIRAVKSTQGLVVFTTDSVEIILGGPLTASFYSVTLAPGIGMAGFNALDIYAGEIYFMDTTGQLRVMSPNLSITSTGFPITDQLVLFNPATAYVAFNEQPNDSAIYVGTGSSPYNGNTGWFRVNPRQEPGSANGPTPVWSPFAAITNGCQLLQSIQVSPGVKKLLIGSTLPNESISERNTSVFTDNGTAYDANAQLGSLMLAHRGELALLKFLEFDFALVTSAPTISYLLNEISGTYTNFVLAPQQDPPSLYGETMKAASYSPLRYYFSGQGSLARCAHMQIGIDFGTSANADECFNLTIYGAIVKNG